MKTRKNPMVNRVLACSFLGILTAAQDLNCGWESETRSGGGCGGKTT